MQQKSSWLWVLFPLLALLLFFRNYFLPHDTFDGGFTHYNNYVIFKNAFYHLLHGKDLYVAYPSEQYDLFKYTPTFALFFGVLAVLPDWLGLLLWNVLNVSVLVLAIRKLPLLEDKYKLLFGVLVLQETITSTMNSQSNVLIAGLLLLSWINLEKGNWHRAAAFVLCTAFIKLFGIVFFLLFLFYPKWGKSILKAGVIFIFLFLIPAALLGWNGLEAQYQSFIKLLANDHGEFVKYSVMGWLQSWFGYEAPKQGLVLAGMTLQLFPVIVFFLLAALRKKIPNYNVELKALFVSTLLIWVVIFNHMAESATFIIAVAGTLLWFFYSGMNKWLKIGLIFPVILFTCFGPSDIFPKDWRQIIVADWQLKVFPCILVWFIALLELLARMYAKADGPGGPSELAQAPLPEGQ